MAKAKYGPEYVETEIARLNKSPAVALARKEENVRYKRQKYMLHLRYLERRGETLMEAGVTMDNIAEWMAGGGRLESPPEQEDIREQEDIGENETLW